MVEIAEALSCLEAILRPVGTERVALDDALGRVCAEALAARLDAPPFAVAAMDGYAVRWADVGRPLRCLGTLRAGDPGDVSIPFGTCFRIFTGAPIPPEADTVVVQELADADDTHVYIRPGAEPRRNVRPAASNVQAGTPVSRPGTHLTARAIGLAAVAGHAEIGVYRQPRVAILSTGNELSDTFAPGTAHQILDANRPVLKALVRAWGGIPVDFGIVPDTVDALAGRIAEATGSGKIDLLVTTGGASVGDFDFLGPSLEHLGFAFAFRKVRMRPGKATLFGALGPLPVLGLPGNAVAALVGALVFLRPALSWLTGAGDPACLEEPARLADPLPATGPRTTFLRGRVGRAADGAKTFAAFPDQDNAMLSGLADADALMVRPAQAPPAEAGTPVTIIRFERMPGF